MTDYSGHVPDEHDQPVDPDAIRQAMESRAEADVELRPDSPEDQIWLDKEQWPESVRGDTVSDDFDSSLLAKMRAKPVHERGFYATTPPPTTTQPFDDFMRRLRRAEAKLDEIRAVVASYGSSVPGCAREVQEVLDR